MFNKYAFIIIVFSLILCLFLLLKKDNDIIYLEDIIDIEQLEYLFKNIDKITTNEIDASVISTDSLIIDEKQ